MRAMNDRLHIPHQFVKFTTDKSTYDVTVELEKSGSVSDGYHTFDELYQFRMLYNAAFFLCLADLSDVSKYDFRVHKSKRHSDGELCFGGGWFIVMAYLGGKQISNHYELKDWDLFDIPEKETADEYDGHTPQDVAARIEEWLRAHK